MLTPYPLIYCPRGVAKPACCPHPGPVSLAPGKGPDAVTQMVGGQEVVEGGGGMCWGGGFQVEVGGWKKTAAGWWVLLRKHRPQDLIRLQAHPRVRRWVEVQGALPDQRWQVPVLLEANGDGWTSALDGIWDGATWSAGDLADLQAQVLAIANGIPEGADAAGNPIDRAAAFRELAVRLLAVGQWVDGDLLAAAGWLSESLMLRTVLAAAAGRDEEDLLA